MRLGVVVMPAVLIALFGCGGSVTPADVDTRNDTCSFCRMSVSDRRLAAQIVGRGEEPRFFDDIGCLSHFLENRPLAPDQVVYVADHRTGEWVDARHAVFSRLAAASTPMGSGLIAHASDSSRDQDTAAHGSAAVSGTELLPPLRQGARR
jgi:copper chaperone NosL